MRQDRSRRRERVVRFAAVMGVGMIFAIEASTVHAQDDPEQLAAQAIAANPSLEARRSRVAELEAMASAAGAWEDPRLELAYRNAPVDSLSLRDDPMSGFEVRAEQMLPAWGTSRLRDELALSRARASEHERDEAANRLRREVFVSYWSLVRTRLLEEVTRRHAARADELLRAVRARYEVGAAGQHELLRLTLLRDRLVDELDGFERMDRELRAALARALSREADSPIDTPLLVEPLAVVGEPSVWLAQARDRRPELALLAQRIHTEETAAELAHRERLPDVTVWVGYHARSFDLPGMNDSDLLSAGVSIPLPWGSATRSRAERAARLQAARAETARHRSLSERIGEELERIHARWVRAYEQSLRYRDELVPAGHAALDSVLADYAVGRADFASLYQAEVDLLDLDRTWIEAAIGTHLQAAEAHAVIGATPQGRMP